MGPVVHHSVAYAADLAVRAVLSSLPAFPVVPLLMLLTSPRRCAPAALVGQTGLSLRSPHTWGTSSQFQPYRGERKNTASGDCECNNPGAPVGHLTLRGTRCIAPRLPRPAAGDLMVAAMVVGLPCADAAAGTVSTPASVVGVRGSDRKVGDVGDDCGGGGGSAGPSRSSGDVWYCTTVSVTPANDAGGKPSEGPFAGGKAPSGDKVDAAAIPSPGDCGTNDEGDGTGATEGDVLFLRSGGIPPGGSSDVGAASRPFSLLFL